MTQQWNDEIIKPTPERIAKGDITIEESDRGGVTIRVIRTFNDPLLWYAGNGHITSAQKRAGCRFYVLWFHGSVRSKHVTSRFDAIPGGTTESDGLEEMQHAYHQARKAIRGVKEKRIAHLVCCEGEAAGRIGRKSGLIYLRSALSDLVAHFGYNEK